MSYFNIVAATTENTVVTEYIPEQRTAEAYQSEADLEREFIRRLGELGYEYLTIHKEDDLIVNLRAQIERLNGFPLVHHELAVNIKRNKSLRHRTGGLQLHVGLQPPFLFREKVTIQPGAILCV